MLNVYDMTCEVRVRDMTPRWSLPVHVCDRKSYWKVPGSSSIWSSGLRYYVVMQVTEKASSNR